MLSTEDMTKEEREEYWGMVIDEFKGSDLTKTAYCRDNEIPVSTFNYWQSRLEDKERTSSMDGNRFVELPIPEDVQPFLRLSEEDSVFSTEIVVSFQGLQILLNHDTPMTLFSDVLEEVGYAS